LKGRQGTHSARHQTLPKKITDAYFYIPDMTTLMLDYPRGEAKTLVKLAFENTDPIETYFDAGPKIIGKTGPRMRALGGSYGEVVTVKIPEVQPNEDKTKAEVTSERAVGFNWTADPDKIESEFMNELNEGRGHDVDDLLEMNGNINSATTKEVSSPDEQAGIMNSLKSILS
jgi:hypothetical protein